jgi:hypothetical protein
MQSRPGRAYVPRQRHRMSLADHNLTNEEKK